MTAIRLTNQKLETFYTATAKVRLSAIKLEALVRKIAKIRVSNARIEVLSSLVTFPAAPSNHRRMICVYYL